MRCESLAFATLEIPPGPTIISFDIKSSIFRTWPMEIQEFVIMNSRDSYIQAIGIAHIELIEPAYNELCERVHAFDLQKYEHIGRS